jgi:hypothetical protein
MSVRVKSKPAAPFVVRCSDVPLIRIPTSAATHAGFRT